MRNQWKQIVLVSAVAGCTAFQAGAQSTPSTTAGSGSPGSAATHSSTTAKPDRKTASFLRDAIKDNQMEVALMQTAAQKAQNPELKQFAQKLQQDHTQAGQQLTALAGKHGLMHDQAMKDSDTLEEFNKEQAGAKWDQKFATETLKHHAKDIQKYHEALKDLQAPDLKQFVQAQLPKLHQHFEEAQTVARAVGVEQDTIAGYARKVPAMGGTGESSSGASRGAGSSTATNQSGAQPQSGTSSY